MISLLFWRYAPFGRSFFSPDLGRRRSLGEGIECWRGFYQSIRPTQMGLSLNIGKALSLMDVCMRYMIKPGSSLLKCISGLPTSSQKLGLNWLMRATPLPLFPRLRLRLCLHVGSRLHLLLWLHVSGGVEVYKWIAYLLSFWVELVGACNLTLLLLRFTMSVQYHI
jgi:hypothetical protein